MRGDLADLQDSAVSDSTPFLRVYFIRQAANQVATFTA